MEKRFVKIGMSGQSVTTVIMKGTVIQESMNGNPLFPDPNPDMTTYDAAIQDLISAQTQVQSAGGGKDLTKLRNASLRTVLGLTRQLAAYVDNVADGDEAIILSSGFEVRKKPSPVGFLSPPGLKVVFGEGNEVQVGVLRAYHQGVKGSSDYVYRIGKVTQDDQPDAEWTEVHSSQRSHVFTGLESGALYELQVATKTAAGVGGFSASVFRRPQ